MEPWVMWTIAAAIVVLPFVLGAAFHGRDRADSTGRRTDHSWRV